MLKCYLSRTDLIIWYDGDTGEVTNSATSLTINDLGDGRQNTRLDLTDSFNRTDHGRQFMCRSQVWNTTCAIKLNIACEHNFSPLKDFSENNQPLIFLTNALFFKY